VSSGASGRQRSPAASTRERELVRCLPRAGGGLPARASGPCGAGHRERLVGRKGCAYHALPAERLADVASVQRSLKLWLVNGGYQVVAHTLMGGLLGVWK
jgi:hypothetical protein